MSLFKRHNTQSEDDMLNKINITPLTDCILVLLIIFMITGAAMSQTGFKLILPKSEKSETTTSSVINISVVSDGRFFINNKETPKASLVQDLKNLRQANTAVTIYGDSKASYQNIMSAIEASKTAGFEQIGLATDNSVQNNK